MREYAVILCSVPPHGDDIFPGMYHTGHHPPWYDSAPAMVNTTPPVVTPASWNDTIHLPLAPPTPRVVYVTVTEPVSSQATGTAPVPVQTLVSVPVPTPTQGETVCSVNEQTASGVSLTGNVYGLASAPEVGIDEIRFTIGLDPCSPALDLTKVQIVFPHPVPSR